MATLSGIFGGRRRRTGKTGGRNPRKSVRLRPALERLEERKVMDASCPGTLVDDMTELARLYTTKTAPSVLWLNFDGQSSKGVFAFASANRDADIQEILFRASEAFSPFNVQVQRMYGDNNLDNGTSGNSTLFIGDHPSNTFPILGIMTNTAGAFAQGDYPSSAAGRDHDLNSDPFNIGYVDPWNGFSNRSNWNIAKSIAHEGAHTFGLAHVLSSPDSEVMSYDVVPGEAFLDDAFGVTNLNNTGNMGAVPEPALQPVWHQCFEIPTPWGDFSTGWRTYNDIVTQNSFDTLSQLLGRRSTSGDVGNVADASAVDPGVAPTSFRSLSLGGSFASTINRMGDYDVYSFTANASGVVRVEVDGINGSFLIPTIMVYRPDLDRIEEVEFDAGDGTVEASFSAVSGRSYRFIVGARDSRTSGDYRVSVDVGAALGANPILNIRALAASENNSADQVLLENVSDTFRLLVNGKLVYSDRADDLSSITVVGSNDGETFTMKQSLPFSATLQGGLGTDMLVGANVVNQWLINGLNAGTLNATTGFSSMEKLKGGSQADTFGFASLGSITGKVDGGGGLSDTLDYSRLNSGVVANLATSQATKTGSIGGIEHLIGGNQADQLTGNGGVNVLRGGGGNDTLKGGAGNDHLFGEAGLDWLYGEAGLDMLDGGFDYLRDMLIGDNAGATDEADTIFNHMRWIPNAWIFEDDLSNLRAPDALVPIYHWETYR